MNLTPEERIALARVLNGEAGGEGIPGMEAVANVIKNRVGSTRFPDNPIDVINQPNQFSAMNGQGNAPYRRGELDPNFNNALSAVDRVFGGGASDNTGGATHYFAPGGMPGGRDPYWLNDEIRRQGAVPMEIGEHRYLSPLPNEDAPVPEPRPNTEVGPGRGMTAGGERISPTRPTGVAGRAMMASNAAFNGEPDPTPAMQANARMASNVPVPTPAPRDMQVASNSPNVPLPQGVGGNGEFPARTIPVNRAMNPLLSSLEGASSATRQIAPNNAASVLNGPYEQARQYYSMFTGNEQLPPINDMIAKAGTSRTRQTPNSQHFQGKAIDFDVRGLSDADKMALNESLANSGFNGRGYGTNILHADTRNNPAGWNYRNSEFAGRPVEDFISSARAGELPPEMQVRGPMPNVPTPTPRPNTEVGPGRGMTSGGPRIEPAVPTTPPAQRPPQPDGGAMVAQNNIPMPQRPQSVPTAPQQRMAAGPNMPGTFPQRGATNVPTSAPSPSPRPATQMAQMGGSAGSVGPRPTMPNPSMPGSMPPAQPGIQRGQMAAQAAPSAPSAPQTRGTTIASSPTGAPNVQPVNPTNRPGNPQIAQAPVPSPQQTRTATVGGPPSQSNQPNVTPQGQGLPPSTPDIDIAGLSASPMDGPNFDAGGPKAGGLFGGLANAFGGGAGAGGAPGLGGFGGAGAALAGAAQSMAKAQPRRVQRPQAPSTFSRASGAAPIGSVVSGGKMATLPASPDDPRWNAYINALRA